MLNHILVSLLMIFKSGMALQVIRSCPSPECHLLSWITDTFFNGGVLVWHIHTISQCSTVRLGWQPFVLMVDFKTNWQDNREAICCIIKTTFLKLKQLSVVDMMNLWHIHTISQCSTVRLWWW